MKAELIKPETDIEHIDQSPNGLITLAIEKGASIEQLEKLLALKERVDAAQNNKLFLSAMSKFQADVPEIKKKKQVGYTGKNGVLVGYKYAELGEIDETIKSAMAANNLSKRWEITEDGEKLICTCIISHISGHTERTTMSSVKDGSGNKNEIQSRASAISYLQRYTLIGALGLTTASEDNDGDGTAPQQVNSTAINNPDIPWLNMTDKSGKKTAQGIQVENDLTLGKTTLEQLRTQFKVSKETAALLSQIKVSDIQDMQFEDIKDVPFEIPGHWYRKLELCKNKADVLHLYNNHKETIDAHPELQKLLKETQQNLLTQKV